MNYELAKQLKDAGFPKDFGTEVYNEHGGGRVFVSNPTLAELIEELPMRQKYLGTVNDAHFVFRKLVAHEDAENRYWAYYEDEDTDKAVEGYSFYGYDPEEAVAKLWLAINKK